MISVFVMCLSLGTADRRWFSQVNRWCSQMMRCYAADQERGQIKAHLLLRESINDHSLVRSVPLRRISFEEIELGEVKPVLEGFWVIFASR